MVGSLMDWTTIRLTAQVLLTSWAIAEIVMLAAARGTMSPVVGQRWATIGLGSFAVWMFLSSLSIQDTALFPRSDIVGVFAILELSAAICAWGWFVQNARARFQFHVRRK